MRMVGFYMQVLISCKVLAWTKKTMYLAKQTLSWVLPLLLAFLVGEHWSLMLRHLTPQVIVVYCPSSLLASRSCPMQVDSSKKCPNLIDKSWLLVRTFAIDSHISSTLANNGGKTMNFTYSTCKISFMLSNDDMLMIHSSCFVSNQSCSMLPWCHT
jgi:hypothetical protein